MRKKGTLTKAVQRARQSSLGFPKVPKDWEEMKVPDTLRSTKDNLPFLVFDGPVDEGRMEKVLVFMSPTGVEVLNSSDEWYADGTFNCAKSTLFAQLFVIFAKSMSGKVVPCAFSFLPSKEGLCYAKVFSVLKQQNVAEPKILHTDFERGIFNGFLQHYPDARIGGCDVHFKRAIRTKLAEFGLIPLVNDCLEFQTFVRYLWSLSLVPPEQVVPVWEDFIGQHFQVLENNVDVAAEEKATTDFLTYFEKTWVGAMKPTHERRSPLFKHTMWNQYQSLVLEDYDTSSNAAEGYNNAFNLSLPKNSSIWMVIKQLINEESVARLSLRDALLGADPKKNKSRTLRAIQRRTDLQSIVQKFGQVPLKEYMKNLIEYYNH